MRKFVTTGQLIAGNGRVGCFFTIEEVEEVRKETRYRVRLISHLSGADIVDDDVLPAERVFPWLNDRRDY